MKKLFLILTGLLLAALTIAGCGGDSKPAASSSSSSSSSAKVLKIGAH